MSDSLRTPNYNDFSVYKDNLLPPAAYFVPFSTAQAALESDPVTARYSSDRVTCTMRKKAICRQIWTQ